MSEYEVKVHVSTDENVHKWDMGAVLDGVLSWTVEELPEARECDDCGIEDGARWDIGPNNQWSVCDGCRDSYGYDN